MTARPLRRELDPLLEFDVLGDELVLTREHLAVAGFVAAFSVPQFAVAGVTHATYLGEFYDDVAGDEREVLGVWTIVGVAT